MKNISEDNLLDLFIGTLKDNVQHEMCLFWTIISREGFDDGKEGWKKNMAMNTRKAFSNTYRKNNVPSSKLPQRLTPQQLDEIREKGLFFNCDNNYSKGHKLMRIHYST